MTSFFYIFYNHFIHTHEQTFPSCLTNQRQRLPNNQRYTFRKNLRSPHHQQFRQVNWSSKNITKRIGSQNLWSRIHEHNHMHLQNQLHWWWQRNSWVQRVSNWSARWKMFFPRSGFFNFIRIIANCSRTR